MKTTNVKRAAIVVPCLCVHTGSWSRFAVVSVDGNLKWQYASDYDTKEEAVNAAKKLRKYWKKFGGVTVCNQIKP